LTERFLELVLADGRGVVARSSRKQLFEVSRSPLIPQLTESPGRSVPVLERNIAGVHHGDQRFRVVPGIIVMSPLENVVHAGSDGHAYDPKGQKKNAGPHRAAHEQG